MIPFNLREALEMARMFAAPHQTGPGKRTALTLHKAIRRSKYSGEELRRIRANHGVGRPPADLSDPSEARW